MRLKHVKKSIEGRIGGDEPYYPSSDTCSFETDEDECWFEDGEEVRVNLPRRGSSSTKKVIYGPTSKKVVWQLGMIFAYVDELRYAVTKYAVQRRVHVEQYANEPTTIRSSMPSSRIVSNDPIMVTRSVDVASDIGFKPSSGLKWKGKPSITIRRLQEIRGQHRIQIRTGGSNNLSQNSNFLHPQ
uniref:Uncharacterized protein n=2 Tax=Nicotiana TaxID=4085 RepID=A0A1S4BMW1_TOBAC|nr:PREDICTED: uncharacterized protein LOC104223418 isoform X1 [Nicotiana sylvestris]XP_016490195.1 PREDICTED: uncharacterized protein LOC107809989 [Nicotiana tabacum]